MKSVVKVSQSILNHRLEINILTGNPAYQPSDLHLIADGWRIFVGLKGKSKINARMTTEAEIIELKEYDTLLVPSGFPVQVEQVDGELFEISYLKCILNFQHYAKEEIIASMTQECHRSLRESSELRTLFQRLQEYAQSQTPLNECKTASQLKILIATAAEIAETGFPKTRFASKKRVNFMKVNNWIKANLDKSFGLSDVSEKFDITPQYLNKLSHYFRGISFNNYINLCRLEKARDLLLNQKDKVKELAAKCGFNDPDYFIQLFRRTYSITPLQFRKRMHSAATDDMGKLHQTKGFKVLEKEKSIPAVNYHPDVDKPQTCQLFCNTLDEIVEILWMESNDSHVSISFLNPGQRFISGSPQGHQWLIKNSVHKILGCYTTQDYCGQIVV